MSSINLELPANFRYPNLSAVIDVRDGMYRGNSKHYLSVGVSGIDAIDRALSKRAVAEDVASALDLPCGYGRVTRALQCRFPSSRLVACDLEKEAVDFCAKTFDVLGFYSSQEFDALDLQEKFDLVWVGSLITHLDANSIAKFFNFVRRHLSKNGIAVVSSHGPFVAGRIRQSLLDDKRSYGLSLEAMRSMLASYFENGFGFSAYQNHQIAGGNYGVSMCSERWLRRVASDAKLSVISYEHHSWDDHQDVLSVTLC